MQLRRNCEVFWYRNVLVLSGILLPLVTASLTKEQQKMINSKPENPDQYRCDDDDTICINLQLFMNTDGHIGSTELEEHPLGFHLVTDSVSEGLKLAKEECKHQFFWDPWNCPVKNILREATTGEGTREVAYLQAISAAGVMYSATKSCNNRYNDLCGCGSVSKKDRLKGEASTDFKWGGCSDNIRFGEQISEQFLNIQHGHSIRLHNQKVGIMAVKRTYKTVCRCLGVGKSCTFKICWKQLADFRMASTLLKKKYLRSKYIEDKQEFEKKIRNGTLPGIKKKFKTDLVHFEPSPDFCKTVSVQGRECLIQEERVNETLVKNSCKTLCCGRLFEERVCNVRYNCDCSYQDEVRQECQKCNKEEKKYYCT